MIADSLTLRRIAAVIGVAAIVQLTGCASISGARSDLQASRQIPQKPAKEKKPEESDEAAGLRLARILVSQQRLEGAAGVYAELDRAYMASLRLPDAKKALETALKFDDRNVSTLNAYGVLTDSMGDHKGAQASFEKALSVSPANISVLNNLALSRLASGDIRGAKKALTDARSFDSGRGAQGLSVRMNLAFTQFMDGDSTRAAETLKEIMAESQAEDTLKLFTRMKARIDAGESTLADECLRASGKLIEIRPKRSDDDGDYGYEVPAVVELVGGHTETKTGLSPKAKTMPLDAAPESVKQMLPAAAGGKQ